SLLCVVFFFPPVGSLAIARPKDAARLLAFVLEGILTCVTMEWLHRARRQAEGSRREADECRKASRRAEDLLHAVIDNTNALIYCKNLELIYIMINKHMREVVGAPGGGGAGLTDYDLFPGEVADGLRANDRGILERGEPIECEEVIPRSD